MVVAVLLRCSLCENQCKFEFTHKIAHVPVTGYSLRMGNQVMGQQSQDPLHQQLELQSAKVCGPLSKFPSLVSLTVQQVNALKRQPCEGMMKGTGASRQGGHEGEDQEGTWHDSALAAREA